MTLRVLHLTGSATSADFEDLSRLYARGCLDAVGDPARYEPLIAHVSPDGAWRFPAGLSDAQLAAAESCGIARAIDQLAELDVDVMVPHMFCPAGMTHYRALFDLLAIPYVGNTPEAMAITARKDHARAIVAAAGVCVPAGRVVHAVGATTVTTPVVVKPVDADNSAGVTLVRDQAEYAAAVERACAHGSGALVEQFIEPGREVRCGILECDGSLVCLPLEEYPLDWADRPIRRAEDKLARTASGELQLVAKGAEHAWIADPEDPVTARVWDAALAAYAALGCRHYGLFDFRIDPAGTPWFLEAGLYCSFSPQSVVATMAAAAGIPVDELFSIALGEALRHRVLSQGSTP
jgi:D-alanine-D-alanine ligase